MIEQHINTLIQLVSKELNLDKRNFIYYKNKIAGICNINPIGISNTLSNQSIPETIDSIIEQLVNENIIENLFDIKEMKAAEIMDVFIGLPTEIENTFYTLKKENPLKATDYFYHLSQVSNYIQTNRIKNNIHYKSSTKYGDLDITINLSKPEKDPKEIKRLKELAETSTVVTDYPKCMLCIENEGFYGRMNYPARSNHRIIELSLNNESWFFQYSPYSYYNEHAIVLSKSHTPMQINKDTFTRLIEFVEQFPHYFIGSNADLPIVGGSMLTHDHYQAGHFEFAMDKAKDIYCFKLESYPEVQFSIIEWPLSVIRLKGQDKTSIIEAANHILNTWKTYSDEDNNIIAHTDQPHNTITPIARIRNNQFELDLVLRNNRTSDEFPMGIFHPHEEHHHIKKENIGLIEVMGLAVLPARLKQDIQDIKAHLKNNALPYNPIHQEWVSTFDIKDEDINQYVDRALGHKFAEILQDAGVFKHLDEFKRFLLQL
ncbi:UDP-glucose--hexose-1-phosphate uridylyltransferase [Macrococcus capreoli]|uniref:UDP-glucose--hexose-1-phosphate uridylyltransferase n=1 Tax=Macrococcus capreoli TaxID=2982690 RepID=UPI0021D5B860|nr:UDP-glucose--hexose-1-phosphate uridylyltransferase [Macrococcus sp. TMW 2.2395]MCU7556123.1 UDP-glucose--hexose-1-phosphate uridylyltransferase [Macrococcus sp. TMW 2.2395]